MKEMFKIKYWKANCSYIFTALLWVCFMIFFTYTTLIVALIETKTDFIKTFHNEQAGFISLFVNFGIIFMLVFDIVSVKGNRINKYDYILPFVAIAFCLIVLAHSRICNLNILGNYICLINSPYLSIIAFVLYILCIWLLKTMALLPPVDNVKKVINS